MITLTAIEHFFCMCGPLERKCPNCEKLFVIDPHRAMNPVAALTNGNIACIYCGCNTQDEHNVRRPQKVIKEERKK